MVRKLTFLASFVTVATATIMACGSGRDDAFAGDGSDSGAASSSSGSSGTSGNSGTSGDLGSSGGTSGSSGGDDGGAACAAQTVAGKQLPLDIHVMLDSSGSMMEQTGADGKGPTKWEEVKGALNAFASDAKSAGIGVGLGIFPVKNKNAPASCTQTSQCTVNGVDMGKCGMKVCSPGNGGGALIPCDSPADCPGNVACRQLGQCIAGIFSTGDCIKDEPAFDCLIGSCTAVTSATCWQEQCVESDYETARVPIATLPGNATAFSSTINGLPNPPSDALTPTAGALQGGLAYAKQYKTQNPDHVVVMVLATDGFPTRCNVTDIPGIAAIASTAANANPAIRTFVIGVFTDADKATAKQNLDAIAAGGGTNSAFIVTTGGNVTQQFQQALDAIRGEALPCEYLVPTPEAGTPDYGKVNVQFTSGGTSNVIGYKKNQQACDSTGGWYYDTDPATAAPKKIILCPSSCTAVKSGGSDAKIDVLLGCSTVIK